MEPTDYCFENTDSLMKIRRTSGDTAVNLFSLPEQLIFTAVADKPISLSNTQFCYV